MQDYLIYLKERSILCARGRDVFEFFQGLMTQDINLLKTQSALYTAFLSPQGKFLFEAFLVTSGQDILLDCFDGEALLKHLKPYKLRRQVTLEMTDLKVYVCHKPCELFENAVAFNDPRKENFATRILATEIISASEDASPYHTHRIQKGIPEAPNDLIQGKTFPLEARLDEMHAISFKKGCYVGQELVSRTHYTGVVRKKLLPLHIEGTGIKTGDEILQNEQVIGEVRSCVTTPEGKTFVMGMIRIEEIHATEPLSVKGSYGFLITNPLCEGG